MRRGGVAMLGNDVDEGRPDDNAVGDPDDFGGLFGGADAETDGDGQVGGFFEARNGFVDAGLRGLLLPGDAGDRDLIKKAAGAVQHLGKARGVGCRGR